MNAKWTVPLKFSNCVPVRWHGGGLFWLFNGLWGLWQFRKMDGPSGDYWVASRLDGVGGDFWAFFLDFSKEYRYTKPGRAVPDFKGLYWPLGDSGPSVLSHWIISVISQLYFELQQIRDHFVQQIWGVLRNESGLRFALMQSIKKLLFFPANFLNFRDLQGPESPRGQ